MRLVISHGYAGTTLAMVRRATGVSASSIYWHFANKESLIAAALEHAYRTQASRLPNWLDTPPSQMRRDDLYAELIRSPSAGVSMEYWRVGLQLAVSRPQEPILARDRFLQIRRESVEWLAQWWERTLPAEMEQKDLASDLLGQLTVGIRECEVLNLYELRRLEAKPLNKLIAACLDEIAICIVETAAERPLDALPMAQEQTHVATPDGSREIFVRATKDVIMELGYDGVTIARVCEKAGLPASSLYWFFKDKDELIATVIEEACQGWASTRKLSHLRPADGDWSVLNRNYILAALDGSPGGGVLALGLLLLLQRSDHVYAGRQELELVMQDAFEVTVLWFREMFSPISEEHMRSDLARYFTECFFRLLESSLLNKQVEDRVWDPAMLADLISTALYRVACKVQDGSTVLDLAHQ
ncbi:hypothetical protein CQ018_04425 [Arthrobacter sp. MYb227]|nr:hypothetical protein CQ018_04425 [Arthrobacter sp. MYb227]